MTTSAPILATTLRLLQNHDACKEGYVKLRKALPKQWPMNKPIDLLTVLQNNGLYDTIWCFRATTTRSDIIARLYGCDCAEHVQHRYVTPQPKGWRPEHTIFIARRYALGIESLLQPKIVICPANAAARNAAIAAINTIEANISDFISNVICYAINAADGANSEQAWQTARLRKWLSGTRTPKTVCAELEETVT